MKTKKYSQERVLQEIEDIRSGKLHKDDSSVFQQWVEAASHWIMETPAEDGFRSFYDRSSNEILIDFHNNGWLLNPLSDEEAASIEFPKTVQIHIRKDSTTYVLHDPKNPNNSKKLSHSEATALMASGTPAYTSFRTEDSVFYGCNPTILSKGNGL